MSVATQPPLQTSTKSKDDPMARIIVLDDLAAEGLAKLESAEGITFDIKILLFVCAIFVMKKVSRIRILFKCFF